MNWLDIVFLVLVAVFVFQGIRQGFTRQAIGLAATLAGLLLAAWFYAAAAEFLIPYLSSRALANIAGFMIVFLLVQLAGSALSWALGKLFKWSGLSWLDRLMGAAFGVVKACIVGTILVLVLTAFPLKPVPASIAGSTVAPTLIEASHLLVYLTPHEVRQGFRETYDNVKKFWSGQEKRSPERAPERGSA